MPDNNRYTVWVGGVPDIEDIDIEWAKEIADEWREQGYDDVVIEKYVFDPDALDNSCQTMIRYN